MSKRLDILHALCEISVCCIWNTSIRESPCEKNNVVCNCNTAWPIDIQMFFYRLSIPVKLCQWLRHYLLGSAVRGAFDPLRPLWECIIFSAGINHEPSCIAALTWFLVLRSWFSCWHWHKAFLSASRACTRWPLSRHFRENCWDRTSSSRWYEASSSLYKHTEIF